MTRHHDPDDARALDAAAPNETSRQYEWVCQKCGQRDVPSSHVTFQETHDGDCGGPVVAELVRPPSQQSAREWVKTRIVPEHSGRYVEEPEWTPEHLPSPDAYALADRCDKAEADAKTRHAQYHDQWLLTQQMERERDEAERQRDDYEAGYRTYAAKCEELQTELNAAQDTIKRQAIDHIATIAELAETRATPPPPPEEERR